MTETQYETGGGSSVKWFGAYGGQSERFKGTDTCKALQREWKGSYTVEAALVMPIVFFVLAALIFASFYIHDRAVCQSIVCETASAGSRFATESERKKAMASAAEQMTGNRFLGSRNLKISRTLGSREAVSTGSGRYPVPGFVMKYLNGGSLTFQSSWTGRIPDPADTIRKVRGVGKLLTGE